MFFYWNQVLAQFGAERCIYIYIYIYGVVYVVWSSPQSARNKTVPLIIPPAHPYHK